MKSPWRQNETEGKTYGQEEKPCDRVVKYALKSKHRLKIDLQIDHQVDHSRTRIGSL